jgi:hypothetical protein
MADRDEGCCTSEMRDGPVSSFVGGRSWWAHLNLTRINIELNIQKNQVEEFSEAGATLLNAAAFVGPFDSGRERRGRKMSLIEVDALEFSMTTLERRKLKNPLPAATGRTRLPSA